MPEVTDKPIEITLGDGSVVKGANLEEAFKSLGDMKVNTHNALKEEKTKREQLSQTVSQLEQKIAELSKPQKAKTDGFDDQVYFKLLNENPIEAANYVDSVRFGIADPKQVPQTFIDMSNNVSQLRQQTVAAQFYANHSEDFPPTMEAAKAMDKRLVELMNQGVPFGPKLFDLAYNELLSEEVIKPLEKKAEEDERPNPSLSGSGQRGEAEGEIAKMEKMTTEEMEVYLRSKGLIR